MPKNTRLLIVDDELGFYIAFRQMYLARYEFTTASKAARGLELLQSGAYDAVLLELKFEGEYDYDGGLYKVLTKAVSIVKGAFPIIIATYDNRKETARIAQELGAGLLLRKSDYNAKVWEQEIQRVIREFSNAPKAAEKPLPPATVPKQTPAFVSVSPQMLDIKKRIEKYVDYPEYSILLLGEPGVGKEVLATHLHRSKDKPDRPFVAVNLAAFNENLLESEIFGHIKGAFSDATSDKIGYFELAKGGTLLLDEIGEISIPTQVKLLRVLEARTFSKVGDTKLIPLQAQLLFTTNRDLAKAVAEGKFRADFYERINRHSISIPPLRARREELWPLIDFLWDQSCRRPLHPLFGAKISTCFTKEATQLVQQYPWPGNVRELKNFVEQLVFESDFQNKYSIDLDLIPGRIRFAEIQLSSASNEGLKAQAPPASTPDTALPQTVELWPIDKQTAYRELAQIEKTLIAVGGRREDAAKILGMKDDDALRYKVKTKYFKEFPELFPAFPIIKKLYKI